MQIRIASWNIWQGRHVDSIIEILRDTHADIIALQEVTERILDGIPINTAKQIAEQLGYHVYFGKAFHTDRHTPEYDFGNAVLSKFPILHTDTHMLSTLESYTKNSETEPRNATEIQIEVDNMPVRILSTHLGYSDTLGEGDLQIFQTKKLLEITPSEKTLILGDFNSTPESTVIQLMTGKMKNLNPNSNTPTWTDMRTEDQPTYHIDYLFASSDINASKVTNKKYESSDHSILIADIELTHD